MNTKRTLAAAPGAGHPARHPCGRRRRDSSIGISWQYRWTGCTNDCWAVAERTRSCGRKSRCNRPRGNQARPWYPPDRSNLSQDCEQTLGACNQQQNLACCTRAVQLSPRLRPRAAGEICRSLSAWMQGGKLGQAARRQSPLFFCRHFKEPGTVPCRIGPPIDHRIWILRLLSFFPPLPGVSVIAIAIPVMFRPLAMPLWVVCADPFPEFSQPFPRPRELNSQNCQRDGNHNDRRPRCDEHGRHRWPAAWHRRRSRRCGGQTWELCWVHSFDQIQIQTSPSAHMNEFSQQPVTASWRSPGYGQAPHNAPFASFSLRHIVA